MDKIWSLFSGNSNILTFLLSPVRFTKCLGVRVPLRPPQKKKPCIYIGGKGLKNGGYSIPQWNPYAPIAVSPHSGCMYSVCLLSQQ
jgi:hypothetical protein